MNKNNILSNPNSIKEKVKNIYGFTPKNIKTINILNWDELKKLTWLNTAKKDKKGNWYCHLEGCQNNNKFDDENEFWIGFRTDGKVDCYFSSYGGMCNYIFNDFYDFSEIENWMDYNVQVNTLKFLNNLVEKEIISKPIV